MPVIILLFLPSCQRILHDIHSIVVQRPARTLPKIAMSRSPRVSKNRVIDFHFFGELAKTLGLLLHE